MIKLCSSCLLFDWGDTLMRDFPGFHGPMKDWPMVEAVPGAAEILAALHPSWTLALATNADDSDEADIRAALRRAGLDQYLDKIYCFKTIGHKKPAPAFFQAVLEDLGLAPERVIMIGDSFENDVLGANRSGLRAIWFNQQTGEVRRDKLQRTVHRLDGIPAILNEFI